MANKYAGLEALQTLIANLKTTFAKLSHKHTISDLTDYKVDAELSSTSTNPIQNKVVDAEFEEIAVSMRAIGLALDGKSDANHNHDDKYYTETEIDTKLAFKSDTTHKHDALYDAKGASEAALASAKTYADSAATKVKNDLLNGAGGAYDTLKELGDLIDDNADAIDALEIVATGKADKVHTHEISDVDGLQTALNSVQTRADNAYTLAESKVGSLYDLGIAATATELNYMDGVTSSVQTQLDELRHDVDAIPQADWNQNDSTQLDFVKNRPFYTTDPVETVIVEGTIPANGMLQTSASINSLTLGEAYNVVFDGVAYNNLVCMNYDGLPSLGNDAFMFAIQSGRAMAYAANGSASHTIKVMALLSSIVPLERKYIAEHIDNLAGEKVAGKSYTVDGESVTAGNGAEVFNDYATNIAIGQYSHAEGMKNTASGSASHAEGYATKASGSYSHAEGYETTASESRSHAEGWVTEATGQAAHAEGFATHATGQFSHAEGDNATAAGRASHAEGYGTEATADYSHAEGMNTTASSEYQHVQGKYNIVDEADTYAHIVGNGTSNSSRKNAHTVDWQGNANFAGDVYVGNANENKAGKKLSTEEYVDNTVNTHVNNKSNPHGVTLSQLGVTATAAELNYVDGVTSNIQKQLNNKVNDYTIEIYNGTGGNPKPVRFASFNYSSCNSENGISAKISLVSGHGNGTSYAFLEDAIIIVGHTGTVEVDNFKYYGAATGTYDGANRQYGDIFWLVDETNKIVDFYCLMGQYARVYQTPWKRLTYSSGGTVTQHTSCTVYSSGTKVWANNSDIALMSDLTSLSNRLSALEASVVTVHSGAEEPTPTLGEDGDIYLVTE